MQTGYSAANKVPGRPNWVHILLGHCSIQAGTQMALVRYLGHNHDKAVAIGALELTLHFLIDVTKGLEVVGFNVDQWLHVGCKVLYVLMLGDSDD